ncbi:MAG TPA: hypothetical protein VE913_20780 [Longimicrobium sp.]|nr:hypothetical protein [Longimicrobium sp.]
MFATDYSSNEASRAALRDRLAAFRIDDPEAAFPFSARLARENGWSREHTHRVLAEYRRFLYLAMAAGHPVSPSSDVDEAWHLHLLYTRSYWEELVPEVLGKPLHHGPTRGGSAESAKFDDWYSRTLASYEAAFGSAPPRDIWPAPAGRFAPHARMRHVSEATHWVIAKPRLPGRFALAAGLLMAVAGCSATGGFSAGWLVVAGIVVLIVASAVTHEPESGRRRNRSADGAYSAAGGSSSGDSGGSCDGGGSCGSSCGGGGCGGCG